jgi:hypothetical protein
MPTSLDPVINDLEAFPLNDRYQQHADGAG